MRVILEGRGKQEFGYIKAAPDQPGTKRTHIDCQSSGCGKPRPGLHKGKAPGIASPERHKSLAVMGCHMT